MVDAYINKPKETIYIVMDLVEGDSLRKYVDSRKTDTNGGMSEHDCKEITL